MKKVGIVLSLVVILAAGSAQASGMGSILLPWLLTACGGLSKSVCEYQIAIEPQVFQLAPDEMCSQDCIDRMQITLSLESKSRAERMFIYITPHVLDDAFYFNPQDQTQEAQIVVSDIYEVIDALDPEEYYTGDSCIDLTHIDPSLLDETEEEKESGETNLDIDVSLSINTVLDDGVTVAQWDNVSIGLVKLHDDGSGIKQFTIASNELIRTE